MMTLLFWDIDGTLLTTGRAGIFAWEDACREVTGCAVSFHAFKTDGLTDHQIAQRIVAQTGGEAADALERKRVCHFLGSFSGIRVEVVGRAMGDDTGQTTALTDHRRDCSRPTHSMQRKVSGMASRRARSMSSPHRVHDP